MLGLSSEAINQAINDIKIRATSSVGNRQSTSFSSSTVHQPMSCAPKPDSAWQEHLPFERIFALYHMLVQSW